MEFSTGRVEKGGEGVGGKVKIRTEGEEDHRKGCNEKAGHN